jgi:hypothetical protein
MEPNPQKLISQFTGLRQEEPFPAKLFGRSHSVAIRASNITPVYFFLDLIPGESGFYHFGYTFELMCSVIKIE